MEKVDSVMVWGGVDGELKGISLTAAKLGIGVAYNNHKELKSVWAREKIEENLYVYVLWADNSVMDMEEENIFSCWVYNKRLGRIFALGQLQESRDIRMSVDPQELALYWHDEAMPSLAVTVGDSILATCETWEISQWRISPDNLDLDTREFIDFVKEGEGVGGEFGFQLDEMIKKMIHPELGYHQL